MLLREGWRANHKRVYRIYSEEGLSIRTRRPKRRRACPYRSGRPEIGTANNCWAMDFVYDRLFNERPFRILTIVDCPTREALATCARTNYRAYQVIEELDRLARLRSKPRSIRVDNGPEFAGRMLEQWAYLNKVELDFSRPGKPTDTDVIEMSLIRSFATFLSIFGAAAPRWSICPEQASAQRVTQSAGTRPPSD